MIIVTVLESILICYLFAPLLQGLNFEIVLEKKHERLPKDASMIWNPRQSSIPILHNMSSWLKIQKVLFFLLHTS